jgi:site-specific recombinase XerD
MLSSSDSTTLTLWLNSQASPHTRSCYRRDADRLVAHVGKPLNAIGLGDLQDFSESLIAAGLAPVSRVRTLAAVKSLFSFCCRTRYLPANPAAELALPAYEQRLAERIMAEEDVARLLAVDATARDGLLLRLIYGAGLRVSEVCNLRWRNVRQHGETGQITVFGKGGKTRSIALNGELIANLYRFGTGARAELPVFSSRSGKPLDRGRVRIILRNAAQQAGLDSPISPHWLRHAHASHALDHGAPIHLVQATLGHSSVATTSAYLHARPGDSSARFLAAGSFPPQFSKLPLPVKRAGVMDVMTAVSTAPGDYKMKTNEAEQTNAQETTTAAPVAEPKPAKATKKATVAPQKPRVAPAKRKASKKATPAKKAPKAAKGTKPAKKKEAGPREGSKTAQVVAMLQRKSGATLAEIMEKMGWQRHTVRGFMAGAMKRAGYAVESFKPEGGERTYRINK